MDLDILGAVTGIGLAFLLYVLISLARESRRARERESKVGDSSSPLGGRAGRRLQPEAKAVASSKPEKV